MCPVDPVDHAEMTALIREQQQFEKQRSDAEEAIELWTKRVSLAQTKGIQDLAEEASRRLAQANVEHREACVALERKSLSRLLDPATELQSAGRQSKLVVDSWKFSAGAGVKLNGARLNMGYSYTYGPEVGGYIDGARYSSRLHEIYAGVDWKL